MKKEKKEYVDICFIRAEPHVIKYFPSLSRLKEVYHEDNGTIQSLK